MQFGGTTMKPLTGLILLTAAIVALPAVRGFGQVAVDTTFTYQGQLKRGAVPVSEVCDFTFDLFKVPSGGIPQTTTQSVPGLPVNNGLFSVQLNFGANAFKGDQRFLQVNVQCPGDAAPIALSPRHALTSAPYASVALKTIGVDGNSLDAPDGSPTNAVRVDNTGKVWMEKGGLIVFDDKNHGINLTSDTIEFKEGTSEDPVYDYLSTTDTHRFFTNGAPRMVIGAAGNVGVGTTTPIHAFQVVSNGVRAISGENTATTGAVYGVYGHSVSTSGRGLTGMATASSGTTYGVFGRSYSTSGRAVYGNASAGTGINYGVYGQSWSTNGRGAYGIASATSGINYGVFGRTNSPNGYAGYFVGGKSYFDGNVGIGELNPQAKLHIGGAASIDGIMFPDGTLQTTAATSGGTSLWSSAGSDIYYNAGNVGIGTTNPTYPLYVTGDTNANAINSAGTLRVYKGLNETGPGIRVTRKTASTPFPMYLHTEIDGSKINAYSLLGDATLNLNNDSTGNVTIVSGGGNVGIGTNNPADRLHVMGDTWLQGNLTVGDTSMANATLGLVASSLYGIKAETPNAIGAAVVGEATYGTGGGAHGMFGITNCPTAAGVYGTGTGTGIEGTCSSTGCEGVYGHYSGAGTGVFGKTTGNAVNYGVRGESNSTSGYGGHFINTSSDGTALYAESAGAGRSDATLQVHNTQINAGMAAYLTSVGTYATMHAKNDGTGEVLWLSKNNAVGEFIVAHNEVTGRRVFTVDQDGWTRVSVLEITGGADLSEQFDVSAENAEVQPGMVVSIDPDHPGKLTMAREPYDRKVAGIVSGAGGVRPGMIMSQQGSMADGKHPIALTGRVWTMCDTSNGPIQPGDLLTTSGTLGHAMKVSDFSKAHGAMIGKAMTKLEKDKGLVLVLVSLQ